MFISLPTFSMPRTSITLFPLIHPVRDLIAEHPLFHPAHRNQIVERREQSVADAVVALPGYARIRAHLHFRDCKTLNLKQRRQESMHALEKFQVVDALALERAVTAAGVADVFAG